MGGCIGVPVLLTKSSWGKLGRAKLYPDLLMWSDYVWLIIPFML